MAISSIQGMNIKAEQLRVTPATDMYTKNIQKQIMDTQKKMQELSSDEKMSVEEKMKKRQELQQEISDLNKQLRQHQAEKLKEQQQEQKKAADQLSNAQSESVAAEEVGTGMSGTGIKAMVSAGTSMKQAQSLGSVVKKLEGRAGVLRAEIKQDAPRGNVEAKERELAEIEKSATHASAAQMSSLKGANQVMEEAAKIEVSDGKTSKTEQNKTGKEVWVISDSQKKSVGISGTGQQTKDSDAGNSVVKKKVVNYASVDIRG